MALLQVGLALGAYSALRLAERLRRPRRLIRLLRERARHRGRGQLSHAEAQRMLVRRRDELHAGSWAVALCMGSYAVPVLTPAALALTVFSMLPMLRASERELLRHGRIGDDLVNAGVCLGGLGLGQPLAAAVQCWVFHIADVAVLGSRERSRRLLQARLPAPRPVRVLRGGREQSVAADALVPGDLVLLAAGEPVPVDGRIRAGSLSVDQQRLTGESLPRALGVGEPVYAGTLVLRGEARIEVTVAGRDTASARVERLLSTSAGDNTRALLQAEAVADATAPPLLAGSALVWPLIGPSAAVALLFSAPINSVRATGALAVSDALRVLLQQGILVKDGRALEALADVDTVLLDKTGTVTADALLVTDVTVLGHWKAARLLAAAAAAEGRLTHPLAQALTAAAREADCPPLRARAMDFRVGFGVSADIDGERVLVGGRRHLEAAGIAIDAVAEQRLADAEAEGATALLVATAAGVHGIIALTTRPRTEAAGILHFLADNGIDQVVLVSGDAEAPTRALAGAVGIQQVHSNVLPEGKAALVRDLQREGRRVCFIGDGVNDALAMRAADCAISLHGAAQPATDAAGILLLDGGLRSLPRLLITARAERRQLRRMLTYWGGFAVLNTGLNLWLRLGVLPSSLLFAGAFGVSLIATSRLHRQPDGPPPMAD